jgi:hypothetical protein
MEAWRISTVSRRLPRADFGPAARKAGQFPSGALSGRSSEGWAEDVGKRCATRKDLSLRSERRSEQPTGPVSDMATTRPSGSLPAADNADGISPATVSSFADDSGAKMLGLPLLELLGKQSPTPL